LGAEKDVPRIRAGLQDAGVYELVGGGAQGEHLVEEMKHQEAVASGGVSGDEGMPSEDGGAGDGAEDEVGIEEAAAGGEEADEMVGEDGDGEEAMGEHEGVDMAGTGHVLVSAALRKQRVHGLPRHIRIDIRIDIRICCSTHRLLTTTSSLLPFLSPLPVSGSRMKYHPNPLRLMSPCLGGFNILRESREGKSDGKKMNGMKKIYIHLLISP
jgi:hypothetical protein